MRLTIPTKNQLLLFLGLCLGSIFASQAQEYNNFEVRYQDNIKGDLTYIANSIVNRDGGTGTTQPEDPYNNLNPNSSTRSYNRNPETGGLLNVNDYKNMQYIDVDSDPSTFSSSTATFAFPDPDCNAIRYAGLYWSATYPSETANGFYDGSTYNANTVPVGTGRQNDFNQVRLKVPGGSYIDIAADEILFDGFTSTDSSVRQNSPYACYADVTNSLVSLANPAGDYTVANIRSVTGSLTPGGGAAAGWTLVIVYENPNLSGKLITTFDGFARVRDTDNVNIGYSGFTTIPSGPVNADIGAATLEGDFRIDGDYMNIRATSNVSFSRIRDENGNLDTNNFFNSDITLDGIVTTNRNPNSINTLGYDTDMFRLLNPTNSVIPNGETSATFQFRTDGDQYYPFFNSFNIEIIEPKIVLEKKVEDIAGNDITGQGVHLGQILDYVLSFKNIGNDDATGIKSGTKDYIPGDNPLYTIKDVLPVNVTLDATNLVLPPGVTYSYEPSTRTVLFVIPDNLVEVGDPASQIRMRVQVAENCFDFIDACSDLIENLAYSTYAGVINDNKISDEASVADFDTCGFITPGATNFLLDDLSDCNFTRTVQLCGDDVVLDAGDNFDEYVWKRDDNGNGQFDATDTTLNDGDPDNDPSTLIVAQEGIYIVDKIVADPCIGFKEIMVVERFGNNRTNPIIEYYNSINADGDPTNDIQGQIVQCSVDGDFLPKIFLCGANDSQPIQINILDAQSMSWERLDETSCEASPEDCANKNLTCTWNQIATGSDYTATTPGKYRLVINYQNGCFNRYHFDVFQNTLDIQYNKTDILCGNDGNITITNLGNGYGYQLVDLSSNTIIVPFDANAGPSFDIAANGAYRVDVVQLDGSGNPIDGACIFSTPDIGILNRVYEIETNKTDATCIGFGSISLSALNAVGQYYYEISQGGSIVDSFGPSGDNNYTFSNLNPGIYDYTVTTDDGCSDTGQIEIVDNTNLELEARVSQHITCREGNILMSSDGGKTPHLYAIWSFVDEDGNTVTSYNDPTEIPVSEYQTSQIFDILDPGSYTFLVVDRNNCVAYSNTVEIEFRPAAEYNPASIIDVLCFGDSTGAIQFDLIDDNGYSLNYYLFEAASFNEDSFNHADALATNGAGYFPGLPSGDYVVVINQRKGSAACDYFEYHTISAPSNELEATSTLIQDYTCAQDAIIEAQNVSGGTAPYSFSIDGINFISDTTPNAHRFENLTEGTYTITVRDNAGCTYPTDPITIAPLNLPSNLTFTATPPTCPASTSDVTVIVTDGTAPYIYEIIAPAADAANNGNNATFTGLAPATYTFRVTDAKNCTIQQDFTITPVNRINALGQLEANITCFGQSDGAITFNVTDFTTSYDYSVSGPNTFSASAQTTNTVSLTGLAAGTYMITVTDTDTNCTDTASVEVEGPNAALALSANETQPTCTSDGSVVLTANDGWGGYSYELTNPDATIFGANTNGSFTGLTQTGTYTATVTDANNCLASITFEIDPAVAPVLAITPNAVCYDDANGLTLTANVTSGGDGDFEYNLNGGSFSTSNTFSNLAPGTYSISVRDGKNCTDTETVTIAPELTVTASADSITACGTDTDISVSAAGGDGNYVYAVVADGAIPGAGDFAAINPVTVTGTGDYDVYVRDNTGTAPFCEASYDITIVQDLPPAISPTAVDVTCFGGSDGSISLTASGGEAPYTYSIDGGTTFGTESAFNNLTAGSYDARARDANNCEVAVTVEVDEPAQLLAEALQTKDYTCLQLGEITVGSVTPASGGSGDYGYSINGGAWTPATTGGAVFANLTDGTYSIRVRDANNIGCAITLPDVIIPPLPVEPVLSTSVTYNCDGTGNIAVLPNDPGYTYSIDGNPAQPGNVFNAVAAGSHTITVDYGSYCTVETPVNVQAGNAFEASITAFDDLDCNGDASGSITFEVDNFGPGGYEYSLDNFATVAGSATTSPQTISGLAAGNYTVTVRDVDDPAAGCTVTLNQNISEPTAVTASNVATHPTCVDDGSVIITALGGTGGYAYEITQPDTAVLGPQGSNLFTGLSQLGLHTITVTDANGCTVTDTFTLVAPPAPIANIDPSSDLCYSSPSAGSATVVVGVSGGTGPFYYNINGGPVRTSNTFSDLIPGSYTFGVRDSNGCTDDISFTIESQMTANVVLTKDIDCSVSPDALLDISVNGGYAPYTYELNIDGAGYNAYTGGFPFTTGTPGVYRFRVTDSQGCIAESNEVVVTPTVNPIATTTVTNPTCNGDANGIVEIHIDPNFGSSPYEVSFNGSGFTYQTVYAGLAAGTYSYTVRDSRLCSFTDTVTLVDPALFDADVVATDVSCGGVGIGDIPGRIDINITSGGVPNFTYTLYDNLNNVVATTGPNPIVNTPATSATFDGLDFGDYYVRILDANGCEYYENPVRVLASPFLTLDTTVIVDCATGGTVEVTADSGSGNYIFSIYDSANTPPDSVIPGTGTDETAIFNGLNAGQRYIFRVIDSNTGCSSYVEADIPSLSSIAVVADPVVSDITCFGDTNGAITFQIEGFDPSVTDIDYEIRESITNTPLGAGYSGTVTQSGGGPTATPSETVNNIPPGDYVLFFRESTSPFCSNTYDFRILEPNPVTLNLVDQNNGTCNADPNVTVLAGGGDGNYTYAFVEDGVVPFAADYTPNNYAALNPAVNTDWDVYAMDGNGCPATPLDITIVQETSPIISGIVANQCAADDGGFTIEITLDTEGIGPHTLSLNGGSFQSSTLTAAGTTHEFTNLSSGNYTVEVRDFNGCGNLITLEIYTPTSVSAEVTTQPTCVGNDGEALITPYGGSGSYMYELFHGGVSVTGAPQASPAFTGLDSGVYTAFVYDQVLAGCNASINIALEVPRAVVFTASSTPVSCFGASDGTITAVLDPSMDNPPYTYQLFIRDVSSVLVPQGVPQTSNIFNTLAASTEYVVRVVSGRSCQDDVDVVVGAPAIIDNIAATVSEFGCTVGNNPDDATVTVDTASITGGSGTYVRYEFVDDNGTAATGDDTVLQFGTSNVLTVTDTAGASLVINVYDDNGCSGSATATVLPFDEMTGASAAVTGTLTCSPGNDGEITVTATSTAGDPTMYEYSINNGVSYQVSNVFSGLAAGTHNFLVRNVNTGCAVTATATLEEPNTFTVDIAKTSDVICFGTNTGEVTFELLDATYPGGFGWEVFDTNGTPLDLADDDSVSTGSEATNGPTATVNLPTGEYYVSIEQANNPFCTNIEYFNIAGPDAAITGSTTVTQITCVPGNDGSIEITGVAGGWGGYTYFVGNAAPTAPGDFVATPAFEGLVAGTYQAWARDAMGCEQLIQDNIVLADPAPINAAIQVNEENCTNLRGEIQVVGTTGGQGSNYTYQLVLDGTDFRAQQNTTVFTGLGAGSYQVRVTDQWGCTFTTAAQLLYEEMQLTAAVTKPIDCTANPGGEITVSVSGGSANLEFTVTMPDATTATQNNGVFTLLTQAGTYSFTVRDLDTSNPVCQKTVTQQLDPPVNPVLLDATIADVSCFGGNDGSIRANLDPNTDANPIYQYELYEISDLVNPISGPQADPLFTGLPTGDYQVKVISGRGCEVVRNETISAPTELMISASATPFSCDFNNSVNTATVSVAVLDGGTTPGVTSGTPQYLYSIDNVTFQSSNTFEVIDNGTTRNITVYVTDGNNCAATTSVTIEPLNQFNASVSQISTISCSGPEEVLISITDDGKPHMYTFDLLPVGSPNGVQTATTATTANYELAAVGSYTFRITDTDTGCYVDTVPYEIAPYDLIDVITTATSHATCFDDAGTIQIEVTGYAGTYDYEVFRADGTTTGVLGSGDTSTNPFAIPDPTSALTGGNYFVRVVETVSPGCSEDSNTVTIISPDMELTAVVDPLGSPTCTNDQGEILVDPSGGYAPYDIVLTNTITGQFYTATDVQAMIFTGLSAGNFTVGITDNGPAPGCTITDTEVLDAPGPIIANAIPLVTDLNCFDDTNGTVTAIVTSGGSGSYEYRLNYYDETGTAIEFTSGQQSSDTFTGLGEGVYSITVVDGWNCDVETNQVRINEPAEVTSILRQTAAMTCTSDAELVLTANGGTAPYQYSIDNVTFSPMSGGDTHTFFIAEGDEDTYQYYVIDAQGCEANISNSVGIEAVPELVLHVDNSAAVINCAGENTAVIYADAEGGLGNYRYELYTAYNGTTLDIGDRVAGPQISGIFPDLAAGMYYVNVTSGDCTAPPQEVVIAEPTPLTYTDSVTNVTCAGENDGSITVTLQGGSGGYQYAISPNLDKFDTENVFDGLSGSSTGIVYTVIGQDQNGCFVELQYTIFEPGPLLATADTTPETCEGDANGTISIEITGGTAPFRTSLNNSDNLVENRLIYTDLAPGPYVIYVRDANDCEYVVSDVVAEGINLNAEVIPVYGCNDNIPENYVNIVLEDETIVDNVVYALDSTDPNDMQLNPYFRGMAPGQHYVAVASTTSGCVKTYDFEIMESEPLTLTLRQNNVNEITAIAQGGRAPYSFYFGDINNGPDNTFVINRSDTYIVTVVDENGCEATAGLYVEYLDIEIPNFFTPNGDNENDFWMPRNIEHFPEILIKIYDRYGRVVAHVSQGHRGWDGLYRDRELPSGDYWYVVRLNGENDDREFVGHFTLYR